MARTESALPLISSSDEEKKKRGNLVVLGLFLEYSNVESVTSGCLTHFTVETRVAGQSLL